MIGFYAHHVGAGHVARASAIARHLPAPVAGLSSSTPPAGWPGAWIELERDDLPAPSGGADPTAQGVLHWAPERHAGLRERMARISAWIGEARPDVLVVDVSVEVAALARLMGVRVVTVAQPGVRADAPHRLGYGLATAVLAPWPGWVQAPPEMAFLAPRLHHVGAFSRADGRGAPGRDPDKAGGRRVLLLGGGGGTSLTVAQVDAARAATPGWDWETIGPPGDRWVTDPWPELCAADVVVTHAGQNAIAEVAAARRPAVVIPQERPFGEQERTARVLEAAGLAVVRPAWPAAAEWPAVLDEARALDAGAWARWATGDGARRAAELIERVACGPR